MLGLVSALLFGLTAAWLGGGLFSVSILAGGTVAAAVVFGTPALFFGLGALWAYRGLQEDKNWLAGLGLAILSFRLEWALWVLVGLVLRRKLKAVLTALVLTALLWGGSTLFWGGGVTSAWALSLQHPSAQVDQGLGLLGVLPGASGGWIPLWWVVYGLAGGLALWVNAQTTVARGMAFSLAIGLLMSPQLELADFVMLAPLFLGCFPHPERPAIVLGLACYVLAFLGLTAGIAVLASYLVYGAFQNVVREA